MIAVLVISDSYSLFILVGKDFAPFNPVLDSIIIFFFHLKDILTRYMGMHG